MVVPVLDREVRLEEVDHREIRSGLAVGHRAALQDQPPVDLTRVSHLPDEARFADSGLTDESHDLAPTGGGSFERVAQEIQLAVPSDEPRQTPRGGGL